MSQQQTFAEAKRIY